MKEKIIQFLFLLKILEKINKLSFTKSSESWQNKIELCKIVCDKVQML